MAYESSSNSNDVPIHGLLSCYPSSYHSCDVEACTVMSRGRPSTVGETRWSPNGYHYTRTEDGWELTHRLIAEKKLGRRLLANERIRFVDGDRKNLEESNIKVYVVKDKSVARRRAELEAKIADLQAELDALDA